MFKSQTENNKILYYSNSIYVNKNFDGNIKVIINTLKVERKQNNYLRNKSVVINSVI